jgi:4-aminobutyrate aminotransferase-like enzyme
MLLPKLITRVPGPKSLRLTRRLHRHESRNVTFVADDFPIVWERASGANVWDVDGNRYVDLIGGFGVANTGHANARVLAAQRKQAAKLLHSMGDVHPAEIRMRLARELSRLTFERWGAGQGKVLFGCSGSDAVELALKTAAVATGKPGVIAFEGAYHGLGYGALDTTWSQHYRRPFLQQLGHFTIHVPFPREVANGGMWEWGNGRSTESPNSKNPSSQHPASAEVLERMAKALRHAPIGAVLLEPIQGRAGIIVPPPEFLSLVRQFCDLHGLLLIVDEIYTGFGRTGKWFAVEHFHDQRESSGNPKSKAESARRGAIQNPKSVVPDLICLGKGMAGGFPISACVGRAEVMDAWQENDGDAIHTSTFFGHPVGCAMALAQIEEIRGKQLVTRSWKLGNYLRGALSHQLSVVSGIVAIRGRGLMIGIEIVDARHRAPDAKRAFEIVKAALRRGLIILADGIHHNVIGLTPPLTISERQLEYAVGILAESLDDMSMKS